MRARLGTAACVAAACATLAGDAPPSFVPQQPTFRAGAHYVRVDVYATLDGEPVRDFAPEDVELLEDGVPQAIDTFEHVSVPPAGPQETRIEPSTVAESRQMAGEARARVFVVFLDTYHTHIEGSARMRLPLVRFLERLLGQDDLVALMTPEMAAGDVTFGRKTAVMSSLMQDAWAWGRRGRTAADNDATEDLYQACYPAAGDSAGLATEMKERRREQLTLDALEDLVAHLGGLREERKAVLTVTEGWRLFADDRGLARVGGSQGAPGRPRIFSGRGQVTTGRDPGTGVDMSKCEADRVGLAAMNNTRRLRDIAEAANRANVSFYPVYPRGLSASDAPIESDRLPSADRAVLAARLDSLRTLAENSDGLAVLNTNDVDEGLRRIVADASSYYLLGYHSTNTKLDGRFRSITVRIRRPGVQVRARRGYRGLTAEEVLAAAEGEKRPAAPVAAPASVAVAPRALLRVRTSAWRPVADGAAAVWVVGELDNAIRKDPAWSNGGRAEIVVVAATGVDVASATLDVAERAFSVRLPGSGLTPGEYAVRVRVHPTGSAGLPVTDAGRLIVAETALPLGDPVLWRRGPSTGRRYVVTADQRFQRNERIRVEIPTGAAGAASARMLDRRRRPMQVPVEVTERPDASGEFRWIVADAALAPLAAGEYAIEVTSGDHSQIAAFRVVP